MMKQHNRDQAGEAYQATDIEVLTGLDPVRRRPGMYTQTERPNHLAQEVIDNSIDEAMGGFATEITVCLYEDESLSVTDNGRGMPVDIHPEQQLPGVELILTRLHAGSKFSSKTYQFSGGLHGVGVSVVNALSKMLEVSIRRGGQVHEMAFAHGQCVSPLVVTGKVKKNDTGTALRFWADPQFFDSAKFSVKRLKHILQAKAVLCPGLKIIFRHQRENEQTVWLDEDGLKDYLLQLIENEPHYPHDLFNGGMASEHEAVEWVVAWLPEGGEGIGESYVNLVPTTQGGTHVNGLRSGLTEAIREFCDFRSLLPRGVKITPDDVWNKLSYVLSVKMQDPQFSGQTKERLSSRECAAFVSGVIKDSFSLWLNHHTDLGEEIATLVIQNAQSRLRKAKKVTRKKITNGPALPGKLADCIAQDFRQTELFLVEGDSAGGSAKQARDREIQAIMPLRGKILNTWEVEAASVL